MKNSGSLSTLEWDRGGARLLANSELLWFNAVLIAACIILVVVTVGAAKKFHAVTLDFNKQENRSRELAAQLRELQATQRNRMQSIAESERLESLPSRSSVSSKASRGIRAELDAAKESVAAMKTEILSTIEKAKKAQ